MNNKIFRKNAKVHNFTVLIANNFNKPFKKLVKKCRKKNIRFNYSLFKIKFQF